MKSNTVYPIRTPFLGANDSEGVMRNWLVAEGARVKLGSPICELETTKAAIEVQSDVEGYFFPVVDVGRSVKVDAILGFVTDTTVFDTAAYLRESVLKDDRSSKITKKAELLITRHKLQLNAVTAFAAGRAVTEDIVLAFLRAKSDDDRRIGIGTGRRVAVIGGVGGGGALIVLDAITRIPDLSAVAVYDRDARFHGMHVLGVPVAGAIDQLDEDLAEGLVDAVVIAFNRDLKERHRVFVELTGRGVPFTNVIDPSVDIRAEVVIGVGNLLLGHVYVGACSVIGDNNFVSANVALEHGNRLGSSCAFGPGVFTSGNVTIGDRVRFGAGVFVEPGLAIGNDSVIGSGQVIVTGVRDGVTLASRARA